MLFLIIAGIILAAIALIVLQRCGAIVSYDARGLAVTAKLSFWKLPLYPARPEEKTPAVKEARPKKKQKPPKKQKTKRKLSYSDTRKLVSLGLKAFDRLLRGLRFERITASLVIATSDPAKTASLYGYTAAFVSVLYPAIVGYFDIRYRQIFIDMDFKSSSAQVEFYISLSIPIWKILLIAARAAFPALVIYFKSQKVPISS